MLDADPNICILRNDDLRIVRLGPPGAFYHVLDDKKRKVDKK